LVLRIAQAAHSEVPRQIDGTDRAQVVQSSKLSAACAFQKENVMQQYQDERLTSDDQLRALASSDPTRMLATMSDAELAAQARHILPDIAGELLAHRLLERLDSSTTKNTPLLPKPKTADARPGRG
jgi:hypothetical protein